jgi:hypothetical protein
MLRKSRDSVGISPFGDEHDPAGIGIGRQGQIIMAALVGGLVNRHSVDGRQVCTLQGQVDIAGANRVHPMPRLADDTRDRRKRHLLGEHQHQRLEQQGEAGEPAGPVRFDKRDFAVRQSNARHAPFEVALMLKEVEVAQPLDLRVVNRVLAGRFGMSKSHARHEINLNCEPALSRIEIDRLHEPWSLDAKRSLEQWVGHERWSLPPPRRLISHAGGGQTNAGRPRRQSASAATLWICGGREEAPPTTPQGQQ